MKLLRDKKGLTIEMGIFMLVVVFALCSLILTFALMLRSRSISNTKNFEYNAALDFIGEMFVKDPETFDKSLPEYSETSSKKTYIKVNDTEKYFSIQASGDDTYELVKNDSKDHTVFTMTVLKNDDSITGLRIEQKSSSVKNLQAELEIEIEIVPESEKESENEKETNWKVTKWTHSISETEPAETNQSEPENTQ